jgi:two-component system OmpR family sensor kinase
VKKSLRSRVVVTALAAVAIAGASIVALIALMTGPVLQQNQIESMKTVLSNAVALDGLVSPDRLIQQITRPGISVAISQDGQEFGDGKPILPFATLTKSPEYLSIHGHLPISGADITIASPNPSTLDTFSQIMRVGVPAMLAIMVVLGIVLWVGMRRALKPLDEMTQLALAIADGKGGGRLNVSESEADTELGRTAVAFDRMLDSLEASLKRAREAEASLRQLCADVAHELRSPLASIVATADNLIRSAPKKPQVEQAAIQMVREGQRASRIVGDLTLVSQLDVDDLAAQQVSRKNIDIVGLVSSVVAEFTSHTQYQVKFEPAESLATKIISADPERVTQIIKNLLQNANRWTESTITIRTGLSDGHFWLQVLDDGPGVPAGERQRIFDRFVRLEPDRARSSGGSGLGLAISRSLAEAHQGTLNCLEHDAPGALFELRLPA